MLQRICRAPLARASKVKLPNYRGALRVDCWLENSPTCPGGRAERKYKDDPHLFDISNTIFWYEESDFGIKKLFQLIFFGKLDNYLREGKGVLVNRLFFCPKSR